MKENFKAKVFLNKSGKGRVKYSEDEFLTLSNREMFKVFPGDEVVCQKMPGSKAKIKEVLKRNTSELTGIIKKYKGKTFLTSLDKSFHLDILLEGKNLFLLPMEPSFLPNGPNLLLKNATRSKEIFQHRISTPEKI